MLEIYIKRFLSEGTKNDAEEIMRYCRCNELFNFGVKFGEEFRLLFKKNYAILNELGICYFYLKQYDKAYECFDQIFSLYIEDTFYNLTLVNMAHCISHIENRYTFYNKEIVKSIETRKKKSSPMVTLTITTCKRFSLFEQTMNSFLNCCTDLTIIDEWFCIDDNSSEEDRNKMKQLYPFFTFYFKSPEEKGHPQSLNIILNKIKSPYIFHLEDDWKFFAKKDYISNCLIVINENSQYGQCLLNKNYIEIPNDIFNIVGGIPKKINNISYLEHEFCDTSEKLTKFYEKHTRKANSAYWAHFSLRPGLNRKSMFTKTGLFDEKVSHFEKEYSFRYIKNNYITTFLDNIHCLHIGRLTSQINDSAKLNAYILNNEKQFMDKEKIESDLVKEPKNQDQERNQDQVRKESSFKAFVVNLDRRADRMEKFSQYDLGFKCAKFSAVDGKELISTPQLQRIFDGNDYRMRRGMVGCALSHIYLTIHLYYNNDDNFYCILEDDIEPLPNFYQRFTKVISQLYDKDWDIVYLGHHYRKEYRKGTDKEYSSIDPIIEKWTTERSLRESLGGTGGYLISKSGASKLLEFINKYGMTNGIDTVQQKAADFMNVYYCTPHLFKADCWDGDTKPDTDIQFFYEYLEESIEDRFQQELLFYKDEQLEVIPYIDKMITIINSKEIDRVYIYKNIDVTELEIKLLQKNCKFPSYTLNELVLVVVPEKIKEKYNDSRYFDRLKKGNIYDIDDAIKIS